MGLGRVAAVVLAVLCGVQVRAADCDVTIADVPYSITQPGVYCMETDLAYAPSSGSAITISADSVTLDLRGHRLWTPPGPNNSSIGVEAVAGSYRVTVRNGAVDGFKYGVMLRGPSVGAVVEHLRVAWSTAAGIYVGWGSQNVVRNCSVDSTGGSALVPVTAGIWLISTHSTVRDNTVTAVAPALGGGGSAFGIIGGGLGVHSNNVVLLTWSSPGTCFALGAEDIYRGLTAQGCATPYAGGVNAGGNFP